MRWLLAAALVGCFGSPALAADGIAGTWIAGVSPTAKIYVFRPQGDKFIGIVCGPCDDPSTVLRIADGTMTDAGRATFSIVGAKDAALPSPTVTLKRVVGGDAPGAAPLVATVKVEPSPAPSRAMEGRWVAAGRVAQQNVTLKLHHGNKIWGVICGPCDNPDGVFLIEDGTLEGDAISFFIHHIDTPAAGVRQNGPGRNLMKGTMAGNVMKFTWVREGRESEPGGEMTLIGPIR